jgi:hypothetical protein
VHATSQPLLPITVDPTFIVGISLNGVFFFAPTYDHGNDVFFPKAFGTNTNTAVV